MFVAIAITVNIVIYMVYPKNEYILTHLKEGEQVDAWLDIYKDMNNSYVINNYKLKSETECINLIKLLSNYKVGEIIINCMHKDGTKEGYDINLIDSMTILLQKEVVQRIVAKSGSKKYGRLSVMINFQCFTKTLFDIAAGSFVPAPKVTSSLVQITPREHIIADIDLKILSKLCPCAFNQRRKMLRSSLKAFVNNVESLLKAGNIDSSLRA